MYLELYGALQALQVQQLATEDLRAILMNKKSDWPDALYEIRDVRHRAAGHPTKTTKSSKFNRPEGYHGIIRMTMRPGGFDLNSWEQENEGEFEYRHRSVDVLGLIRQQEDLVTVLVEEIVATMENDEEAHRSRFRDSSAAACLNGREYPVQKVLILDPQVGSWATTHLESLLDAFVAELRRRTPFASMVYPSVTTYVESARYDLTKLGSYFDGNPNGLEVGIAEALGRDIERLLDDLVELAIEIDRDYGSDGGPGNNASETAEDS